MVNQKKHRLIADCRDEVSTLKAQELSVSSCLNSLQLTHSQKALEFSELQDVEKFQNLRRKQLNRELSRISPVMRRSAEIVAKLRHFFVAIASLQLKTFEEDNTGHYLLAEFSVNQILDSDCIESLTHSQMSQLREKSVSEWLAKRTTAKMNPRERLMMPEDDQRIEDGKLSLRSTNEVDILRFIDTVKSQNSRRKLYKYVFNSMYLEDLLEPTVASKIRTHFDRERQQYRDLVNASKTERILANLKDYDSIQAFGILEDVDETVRNTARLAADFSIGLIQAKEREETFQQKCSGDAVETLVNAVQDAVTRESASLHAKYRPIVEKMLANHQDLAEVPFEQRQKVFKKLHGYQKKLLSVFKFYAALGSEGSTVMMGHQEYWRWLRDGLIPDAQLTVHDVTKLFDECTKLHLPEGSPLLSDDEAKNRELSFAGFCCLVILASLRKYPDQGPLVSRFEKFVNSNILARSFSEKAWNSFMVQMGTRDVRSVLRKHGRMINDIFKRYCKKGHGSLQHVEFSEFTQIWVDYRLVEMKISMQEAGILFGSISHEPLQNLDARPTNQLNYSQFVQLITACSLYYPSMRSPFIPLAEKLRAFLEQHLQQYH